MYRKTRCTTVRTGGEQSSRLRVAFGKLFAQLFRLEFLGGPLFQGLHILA